MKNLSGKIYYGLHFQQGVAEYKDMEKEDGTPLRIFINSETAKRMDSTFAGKPVFVKHKSEVTEDDFNEADGYVVESFFNQSDGNHWAKFIITTEEGEKVINQGFKLSNAYFRRKELEGGRWHGVDYDKQVTEGEYEHLALVDDPRYEESIILTPNDFKAYNALQESELLRLKNSKSDIKSKIIKGVGMLHFFKKEKVENSADLETMAVILPRSGKEINLDQLIRNADESEIKKDEPVTANGAEMVTVGDDKMSVNELVEKYEQMRKAKNESDEEEKAKNTEDKEDKKPENEEEKKKDDSMENEDDDEVENESDDDEIENEDDDEDLENSDDEDDKKSKNSNFKKLQNAEKNSRKVENRIDLGEDKTARGKARYGS